MKSVFPFVICAALSLPVLAQQVEAMKHGDPHAEAEAQARVDARAKVPLNRVIQPEAERSFNARAAAVAESRKAQRLQSPKHPADRSHEIQQYQEL
ncbi:hypothetical protein EZ313_03080 [Ramlibacter henchirensis]|uniref:DUF4148 domain-containing protein n=1 Tax=Ramlibacter henchirensis TaxID=204072 RepID=A0A4Z0C3Y7_9BURK|nr:hypothetical protein [Ramlibacter henchirensis]TFZ05662.1 hypothetical protein EZ313_03080 [Ramlibacter henchirensis]